EDGYPGLLIAEHPRNMGIPKAFQLAHEAGTAEVRRMRIALFVGKSVVAAVCTHPEQNGAFEDHRTGDHQHALEERGCLERLVREVAMEPDADAEHLNRIEHREKCVVEPADPAVEHQVHRDRETGGRYPDCDRSDDAFGASALRVQLHDRST